MNTDSDSQMVSDHTLLYRYSRRGNMDAFQELMDRHEQPLLRLAYVMLQDVHGAQEVVQDCFMRCADKAAGLVQQAAAEPISGVNGGLIRVEYTSLRSWLCRVCRNLSVDRIRAKKPTQQLVEEVISHEYTQQKQQLAENETEDLLWQAVQTLPAIERTVVILRYQEKLSYKELAQQLGKSVNHIGLLLHQAHEKLRSNAVLRAEVLP